MTSSPEGWPMNKNIFKKNFQGKIYIFQKQENTSNMVNTPCSVEGGPIEIRKCIFFTNILLI